MCSSDFPVPAIKHQQSQADEVLLNPKQLHCHSATPTILYGWSSHARVPIVSICSVDIGRLRVHKKRPMREDLDNDRTQDQEILAGMFNASEAHHSPLHLSFCRNRRMLHACLSMCCIGDGTIDVTPTNLGYTCNTFLPLSSRPSGLLQERHQGCDTCVVAA